VPRLKLRLLNHWDNLDGSIERGYAGQSIFDWKRLPEGIDPRLTDYARANASLGINGAVLNNVNAEAAYLTSPYLKKVGAIAAAWRPYGIKVYLTARFSAPLEIGGLKTADPWTPPCASGGGKKLGRSIASFPTSAAFWSKPMPRANRVRKTTSARMPRAPICWQRRWLHRVEW